LLQEELAEMFDRGLVVSPLKVELGLVDRVKELELWQGLVLALGLWV